MRTAVVTGGGTGIGRAVARRLVADVDEVVIVGRRRDVLEETAAGAMRVEVADLRDPDEVAALAERLGAVDVLVLNAGRLGDLTPVQDVDGKEWNQVLTLNLLVPQALLAAFHHLLHASARARVVGITSSVGAQPRAFWGAYGASKAGLDCSNMRLASGVLAPNSAAAASAARMPGFMGCVLDPIPPPRRTARRRPRSVPWQRHPRRSLARSP